VAFLLAVVASDRFAELLLILSETVAFVNVVEYYSVRVVPIGSGRGYYASGCFPEPWSSLRESSLAS
jgi:hypothetical protein